MNNHNATMKGYAYLSPNISVGNAKELPAMRKLKQISNGAGQLIGSTTATSRSILNPRLTDPLNYT